MESWPFLSTSKLPQFHLIENFVNFCTLNDLSSLNTLIFELDEVQISYSHTIFYFKGKNKRCKNLLFSSSIHFLLLDWMDKVILENLWHTSTRQQGGNIEKSFEFPIFSVAPAIFSRLYLYISQEGSEREGGIWSYQEASHHWERKEKKRERIFAYCQASSAHTHKFCVFCVLIESHREHQDIQSRLIRNSVDVSVAKWTVALNH